MLSPRRFLDLVLLLALIAAIAVISHFAIADRLRLLQFIFPAEALAAKATISCSSGAPAWMAKALGHSTEFSAGGQLAFIDEHGRGHHCQMGWYGYPLISERIGADAYFRLGSLTKVATSLAYARLGRDGKLDDTTYVADYFPPEDTPRDPRVLSLRLEHLHRHTAGFDRLRTPDPMFLMDVKPWCPYRIEQLYATRLDFAPGARSAYGNLNYCLLGEILGAAQGSDYRSAVNELLGLSAYDLQFMDGPFLPREVDYDYRNTGFHGPLYPNYYDFVASSAAISLVGTARAFSQLVFDHKDLLAPLFQLDLEAHGCRPEVLDSCFYYSMYPMQRSAAHPLVFAQAGNIWGVSAFVMVDERGAVLTWAGKGSELPGSGAFGRLKWALYELFSAR